ncbi:MAG TPA: ROK family protein [Candidatus Sulfotelmatobacter sp.]|nr:ROK family protein [Candidatus Sulfotelmatobacter sp.]
MHSFAIGVDLGGTNLRIAAVEDTGRFLQSLSTTTEVGQGRDFVIEEMSAAIRELARQFGPTHKLIGIGVGIPGIIDLASGTLHSAANLPGWSNYPVRRDLENRLGVPVLLENDANCAALGEKWLGAGADVKDLCMITLGTGVGGGFVIDGKPWHGMIGMAGEVGHMTVFPEGRSCACGNSGCLEQYASATAIRRMAIEAIEEGRAADLARCMKSDPEFSSQSVFQCAVDGDPVAREIFANAGRALGIALGNLINAFNFPLYVVGGGMSRAWEVFAPALFSELRKRSIVFRAGESDSARQKGTMVAPAKLAGDAGLAGAAYLPMITRTSWSFCSLAV